MSRAVTAPTYEATQSQRVVRRGRRLVSSVRARIFAGTFVARLLLWAVGLRATGYSPTSRMAALIWSRWDAAHYLRIAEIGYTTHGRDGLWIVFFPLFPALVRVVALTGLSLLTSGLVVASLTTALAAVVLHSLVASESDDAEANRAVILLFAMPTAYFLATPYTEGLFLLTCVSSLYLARRRQWWLAALMAAAATATRITGLAVLPALAVEAWIQGGPIVERAKKTTIAAMGALGFGAYLMINFVVYGSPLHFMAVEQGRPWYQHAVWFWQPIAEAVHQMAATPHWAARFVLIYPGRLAAAAIGATLLIVGRKRLRPPDQVFGWTSMLLSLSGANLISLPRYVGALYPMIIVGAHRTSSRRVFWAVVTAGVLMQVWLFSRYAQGLWAY